MTPTAATLAHVAQRALAVHRAMGQASARARVETRGQAIEACLEAALCPGGDEAFGREAMGLRREAEEEVPLRGVVDALAGRGPLASERAPPEPFLTRAPAPVSYARLVPRHRRPA